MIFFRKMQVESQCSTKWFKSMPKKKIIYPNDILYQFLERSQNRKNPMAYVVGYKNDEFLITTEIIFPDQSSKNSPNLDKKDFGKY